MSSGFFSLNLETGKAGGVLGSSSEDRGEGEPYPSPPTACLKSLRPGPWALLCVGGSQSWPPVLTVTYSCRTSRVVIVVSEKTHWSPSFHLPYPSSPGSQTFQGTPAEPAHSGLCWTSDAMAWTGDKIQERNSPADLRAAGAF